MKTKNLPFSIPNPEGLQQSLSKNNNEPKKTIKCQINHAKKLSKKKRAKRAKQKSNKFSRHFFRNFD
jgi:hypothetical protein